MAEAAGNLQQGFGLRRWFVVAAALVTSACATIVPRGAAPPDQPPPPPPSTSGPVTTPRPIEPGLPQDAARHRVALLVPMSGPNAGVGQSIANATQLALLDTRSEAVRITTYDTARGAAAAAQQALSDGNRLILGPLLSDDVVAVAPIARRANVPVISFSNDSDVAGNGTYILGYTPAQSIARIVEHARSTGITRFAGLVPSGLYGQRASTAYLRAVEDAGGQVVALQTYDRSRQSISAAVSRLSETSPYQAVLVADSASTAGNAVTVLRRSPTGREARVLGTELWNTDSSLGSNGALAGAWYASVPNNLYRQFATKYRTRFGAAPYRLASLGYDAVLLTVRIARDWDPGDRFPSARLTDSDGYAGLDGPFRFGRNGVAQRALEVQEVRGGTTVTVSPAPRTFD